MKLHFRLVFACMLLGPAVPLVSAQETGENPEINVTFPVVSGKGALTITGGGYWVRETYEDGDQPYLLDPVDSSGQPLPDGLYRYQFRSISAGGNTSLRQKSLLKGEDAGQGQGRRAYPGTSQAATTLSGAFEVVGGAVIYR